MGLVALLALAHPGVSWATEPRAAPAVLLLAPLDPAAAAMAAACSGARPRPRCEKVAPRDSAGQLPVGIQRLALVIDRDLDRPALAVETGAGWFVKRLRLGGPGHETWIAHWQQVGPWLMVVGSTGNGDPEPQAHDYAACEYFLLVCDLGPDERPRCTGLQRLGRVGRCGHPGACAGLPDAVPETRLLGAGRLTVDQQEFRLVAAPARSAAGERLLPMARLEGPFRSVDQWCGPRGCLSPPEPPARIQGPSLFDEALFVTRRSSPRRRHLAGRVGGQWFVARDSVGGGRPGQTLSHALVVGDADTAVVGASWGHAPAAGREGFRPCTRLFIGCRRLDPGSPWCARATIVAQRAACRPHRDCSWLEEPLPRVTANGSLLQVEGKPMSIHAKGSTK